MWISRSNLTSWCGSCIASLVSGVISHHISLKFLDLTHNRLISIQLEVSFYIFFSVSCHVMHYSSAAGASMTPHYIHISECPFFDFFSGAISGSKRNSWCYLMTLNGCWRPYIIYTKVDINRPIVILLSLTITSIGLVLRLDWKTQNPSPSKSIIRLCTGF